MPGSAGAAQEHRRAVALRERFRLPGTAPDPPQYRRRARLLYTSRAEHTRSSGKKRFMAESMKKDTREARLAQALKANLRRRKAQARARSESSEADAGETSPSPAPDSPQTESR